MESAKDDKNLKVAVARRQLGTALSLFLTDDDPVSVHCLACGGAELSDFLAKKAGTMAFSQQVLLSNPNMKESELVSIRNKYWNALKHARTRKGSERDDTELLNEFDDQQNDHILFIGWYDYAAAVGSMPIEAQVFQAWYFAIFPEKLADNYPAENFTKIFQGIQTMNRSAQKRYLRKKIAWARKLKDVMLDSKTDRRKLIISR